MPELPEVETVRATLEHQILGYTIKKVQVFCPRIVQMVSEEELNKKLANQTIRQISRYGKYLIFILDDYSLISHLRMEGKYFLKESSEEIVKHEHVIFSFTNGKDLRYHDVRKFGIIKLVNTTNLKEIMKEPELAKLGPEAHSSKNTPEYLYNKLHSLKECVKTALLDQTIICGLGNIYVDEVDFLSNLLPMTPCKDLTYYDCEKIVDNSRIVLSNAILAGGTTIRSYTSSLGVTGRFQLNLKVHTKAGEPCPVCGTTILKTRVGGRGTYYCPNCQKSHPLIIGLTGSIGSGKSTIATYLKEKNYEVIDTDEISRKLTHDNKDVLNRIKELFGEKFFDGEVLKRKEFSNYIFNNKEEREKLNKFLHPIIKEEVFDRIKKSNNQIIFVDVPLLFESGFDKLCNKTICIYTNEKEQIKRLIARDKLKEEEILKRINSQMPMKEKMEKANFIIDNSGELCYTINHINELLKKLEGELEND